MMMTGGDADELQGVGDLRRVGVTLRRDRPKYLVLVPDEVTVDEVAAAAHQGKNKCEACQRC